ncbi:hypothetical protein PAXRUDRAFT_11881 [Paxillus rubicundulus Ve08.2h10]|uniref:Cytochrome P450 n=1 Tax=Paxillus rubicundulus Ve08.2h10 TaxID=930991 RepID=A0A0D0DBZ1_9AGAM|nr:hypothetical protein PAXRUDRAFT_11881 [Paxillus rubicundulus Ve08.2h10]
MKLLIMQLQGLALQDGIQVAYGLVGIVVVALLVANLSKRPNLDAIPTVGCSTWLGSWWASIKCLAKVADIIQEGYEKHKGSPFKVAGLYRWTVVVSGSQFVEEVRKASDDELSFMDAANDSLNLEYTLGHDVHHNPFHVAIIRCQLTRNLGNFYPDLRDEIVTAFEETLDLPGNGEPYFVVITVRHRLMYEGHRMEERSRIPNRPEGHMQGDSSSAGRNPDWIDLAMGFTLDVIKGGVMIGLFPKVLAPLVARFMTNVPGSARRGMKLLGPIIEERQKHLEEYGKDWVDKPNDFLSWLMDHPEASESSIKDLTLRILSVNFAAIHTSSNLFTQALYIMAANPQYMQPLREEVESIVEKGGWSKGALAKMRKIDSFLTECHRIEGIGCVSMTRKVMKDFTFSDGTVLPKGTLLTTASQATHLDNANYENAGRFDPFRFANMREEEGEAIKHSYASTNSEYLAFGHGKHAW